MQWLSWILILAGALIAGYLVYRADRRRSVPQPWLTALLRGLTVGLSLALLLAPAITITRTETREPVIVVLQDDSRSIPEAGGDTALFRQQLDALAKGLESRYKVVRWSFGASVQSDTLYRYRQPVTDIAAALERTQEFYGQQNLGAVVLATDGRFNQGSNPLFQNLAFKGPLYTVPLGDSAANRDVRIGAVYANRTAALGSNFEIRADLLALGCDGIQGAVSLQEQGGSTLGSVPYTVAGNRYDRSVSFSVVAARPGLHHYILSAAVADGERNTVNNRRDVFVEVTEEKKNILILAQAPHPDVNAIREALQGLESYQVTVRTAEQAPASFADYQVVVMHGLPSGPDVLKDARKPVWFVLSSASNLQETGRLQDAVLMNGSAQYQQDVYARPVASFALFSLPTGIQAVADRLPPLSVPTASFRPGANTTVLFSRRDDNSQPLWVLQGGNRPVALLLGEGLWRWRLYEYRYFGNHNTVDECIRQTVSFLAASADDKPFRVMMGKYVWSDQEAVFFNASLFNPAGQPVNTPDVQLTVTDSAGRKRTYNFERSGNAYRLNTGVWASGTYSYTARCAYNSAVHTATGSFVVHNQPLELMETGADYPFLNSLARRYNGRMVPVQEIKSLEDSLLNNENIRPLLQSRTETMPLVDWKWYFFLILLLATAEWLLRKYRLV